MRFGYVLSGTVVLRERVNADVHLATQACGGNSIWEMLVLVWIVLMSPPLWVLAEQIFGWLQYSVHRWMVEADRFGVQILLYYPHEHWV